MHNNVQLFNNLSAAAPEPVLRRVANKAKKGLPSTEMFDYQWRIPGSRRPAKCFCSKSVPGVSPITRPPNVVGNCGDSGLFPEEAISEWKALNQKGFVKVAQAEGVEEANQCCQECSRLSNDTQAFLFSNVYR